MRPISLSLVLVQIKWSYRLSAIFARTQTFCTKRNIKLDILQDLVKETEIQYNAILATGGVAAYYWGIKMRKTRKINNYLFPLPKNERNAAKLF